jgi:hypothetical protein
MENNHLNIIMLVGIHTVLTAIATGNFGKAFLVSGVTSLCFLMFTATFRLSEKVSRNSKE